MRIGVAKEIKQDECRVALTPAGAGELRERGHEVVVETGAGAGSAFPDSDYLNVGARLASVDEVWATADMVLKVKEPLPEEYGRLRDGLVLFTYLHLAADEELTRTLIASGATCIAYETVETDDGRLPLLAPMSEVAGRLATQMGAWALEKAQGGRGLLLGGVPGVPPAKVVVLGGGIVGYNAALIAVGMQADVWILDKSVERMRDLEMMLDGRITLSMSNRLQIELAAADADLIIGAVLIPGARAPKLITREMLAGLKPGAVLVDVAIDQGGCFETSRPTTHSDPITSTFALTNMTLPYVEAIAELGVREAIMRDRALWRGVNVLDGKLTYEAVAEAHGLPFVPLEQALPLEPVT
jgi:alanine dehydrogenase